MGINVEEKAPGHITITCENSGLPLTRSNQYGMFCDAEICTCEVKSKELFEQLGIGGKPDGGMSAAFENMFGSLGFK